MLPHILQLLTSYYVWLFDAFFESYKLTPFLPLFFLLDFVWYNSYMSNDDDKVQLPPLGPDRGPQTSAEIEAMEKLLRGESLE